MVKLSSLCRVEMSKHGLLYSGLFVASNFGYIGSFSSLEQCKLNSKCTPFALL